MLLVFSSELPREPSVDPACLVENPYGLVSLWDMLRVFADSFIKLLDDLKQAETELSKIMLQGSREEATRLGTAIGKSINELEKDCLNLDLRSASKQVRHIQTQLTNAAGTDVLPLITELRRRTMEDLEDRVFLCLEPSRTDQFYIREQNGPFQGKLIRRPPEIIWGDEVCSNFKSAIPEIEHATSCLIVDEGTASVFHLMRVLELGLRALAKGLDDTRLDPKLNTSWETILRRCDDELKLPHAKRSAEWKAADSFFVDVTAHLRAVKDAWRNPTMHVEKTYDYDDALHIWNTVRAFMRRLAMRLSD